MAAAVERGAPIPEALIPPRIGEIEAPFWEGFVVLNQTRDPRAPSPLALGEILAWCELAGISDPVGRREFLDVVRAVDRAWCDADSRPIDAAAPAADHPCDKPPLEDTE